MTYEELTQEQRAMVDRLVSRAKAEICADCASGRFRASQVDTFADLHDYVDANEYGGLCEDGVAAEGERLFLERTDEGTVASQGFMDACEVVQDRLARWIEHDGLNDSIRKGEVVR